MSPPDLPKDFRLRSIEREMLEIELLTTLIVQIESYNKDFSGFEWSKMMQTVKRAKELLGLDKI